MPDVQKVIKIDATAQNYEKLEKLEGAVPQAEEVLRSVLSDNQTLNAFGQIRQRVLRVLANPLVSGLIAPALPDFLGKRRIEPILQSVQDYLSVPARQKIDAFTIATQRLSKITNECTHYDTQYVGEIFLPFFRSISREITADLEHSPLTKSGALVVQVPPKRYPFGMQDAELRFALSVENIGAGAALDVAVTIGSDDCFKLLSSSQFLDDLEPGSKIEPIEFRAAVAHATTNSIILICQVTWSNGDGTSGEFEELFELHAQSDSIPWSQLKASDPYSLEPIRRSDELVGREEQLNQLVARLKAPSVGSFWIHGQKRGREDISR